MATPPPPVPPPAPPPPTPAARLVLVVEGVPRAVADLPPNSPVPARVAQAVARGGMVQLQTAFGVLTARTPVALPAGAEVTLRTQPAQPGQAALRLMTVNGRPPVAPPPLGALGGAPAAGSALPPGAAGPPGPGALGAGRTASTGGPGQGAPTGAPSATATGGAALPPSAASGRGLLTATVVRAADGSGAAAPPTAGSGAGSGAMPGAPGGLGAAAGLTVGSRLSVFVTGIQPPGVAGQGAAMPGGAGAGPNSALGMPGAAGTGGPAGFGTSAGAGTPSGSPGGAAGASTPTASDGASVAARAAQAGGPGRPGAAPWVLTPGSAGAASASPSGQPGTLGGTVLNGGAPSATLLRTPAGTVALPVRLDAPPGSTITLAVTRIDPAQPGGEGIRPIGPMTGGRGWPTLPQALETLARADPTAARGLEAMIPRPGPHLAAAMITLTGALRVGGDVRQWPGGGTMRALDRAGPTGARLAAALKEDVGALAGQVRDSPGGEWRAYTLPFADQAEISPIRLIVGPHGGSGDAPDQDGDGEGRPDGDGDGQRFLVDVSLSVLGRVQLDGIVDAASHRLRLLLRTAEPLPGPLRADLLRLTEDSLFALGLQGGLVFQADGGFFDPVPDAPIEAESESGGLPFGDGGAAPDGGVIA